jgi:hypothetical protein
LSAISNVNFASNFPALRDPVTVVAPLGTAYNAATTIGPLMFLVGAASLVIRFRRSGQEQRLQIKWFMYASAFAAVATLTAAALFSPLRRRVQRLVDRRFNRVRFDADQTVAGFAAGLWDAVDLDTVQADLLAVVNWAVEPAHVSVWIASSTSETAT